jgi:hypothetical protein
MSIVIRIARDFTTTPGPRHIEEGDFSGELFRKQILAPAYERATASKEELVVDLNGTEGYATSFLEESFGGLARTFGETNVTTTLRLLCDDDPYLIDEINQYISEANSDSHRLTS